MTSPARKSSSRKSTAKAAKPRARKATARKATARKAAPKAAPRKAAPKAAPRKAARKAAPRKATARRTAAVVTTETAAPPAGSIDLAGGLRAYLGSIDGEVRAVSALSERIDALVTELNDLRDQQAKRLIVLDELRSSVTDQSLGSFLNAAIKPRKTRVVEVIPERLL